jgi:hypothetical protein
LGTFSVFFTQSPSFLAHQTSLKMAKGKSNAETIFGIDELPRSRATGYPHGIGFV